MKELFNEEQKKYIIDNYESIKYKDIANHLGTGFTAEQIAGWLHNNGYKKTNRSMFSKSCMDYIESNYMRMTYLNIANNLGFTEKQVRHYVEHYLPKKTKTFNKNYFQNIDSPDKAYWLGYIFADGNVFINEKSRSYCLGMTLQSRDVKVLEDLRDAIGCDYEIKHRHSVNYILNNKKPSESDCSILRIYSKKLVCDLISHDIVPNKTYMPQYPKPDKYFIDYLRGYIDGDGCIYVNKKRQLFVYIVSYNLEALRYYSFRLLDEYGINSKIYTVGDHLYRLYIYSNNAKQLLDLLYYDDSVQKLERKYIKYKNLKAEALPTSNDGVINWAKSVEPKQLTAW